MSEHQDPLSQLWQNQKVDQVDLTKVSKKWRKVKIKQRCYVVLDFFSVVIPSLYIWFKAEKIDSFTMALLIGVMSLSVMMVFYITWLRRFSLSWSNVSTDQHIQQLQKQIQNNIKIANLSLHSVWFVILLFMGFYGTLYYFEVFPVDKFKDKVLLSLIINVIALPCVWVWASKRKKRFSGELVELDHLINGSKN